MVCGRRFDERQSFKFWEINRIAIEIMKTNGFKLFKKSASSGKLMAFLATAVLLGEVGLHAATLTPATGGTNISAATAGGSYTSLTGPIYVEGALGDVGTQNLILNAPSGFVFNTNSPVSVLVPGDGTKSKNINNNNG